MTKASPPGLFSVIDCDGSERISEGYRAAVPGSGSDRPSGPDAGADDQCCGPRLRQRLYVRGRSPQSAVSRARKHQPTARSSSRSSAHHCARARAYGWSAERRQAYANDLGFRRSLVAVAARSNRCKSDKDPAQWLPPAQGARCAYAADWTATKIRWKLSVDQDERGALLELAKERPDASVEFEAAGQKQRGARLRRSAVRWKMALCMLSLIVRGPVASRWVSTPCGRRLSRSSTGTWR